MILTILRGISGSGKSTLAKRWPLASVFSTDNQFISDGEYLFDPTRLADAHKENQRLVECAMQACAAHIVVDNTNTKMWMMVPYARLAVAYGYAVNIEEPATEWRFDVDGLVARNAHGVPRDTIKAMIACYEHDITPEDLLAAAARA